MLNLFKEGFLASFSMSWKILPVLAALAGGLTIYMQEVRQSQLDVINVLRGENLKRFEIAERSLVKIDNIAEKIAIERMDPISARRNKLLAISNVNFHFKLEEEIGRLYDEYFKEQTIEELIEEVVTESSGDIGVATGIVEGKAGIKNIKKLISKIKLPNASTNEMFLRWQRENIENKQITVGLELEEIEPSGVDKFDLLLDELGELSG